MIDGSMIKGTNPITGDGLPDVDCLTEAVTDVRLVQRPRSSAQARGIPCSHLCSASDKSRPGRSLLVSRSDKLAIRVRSFHAQDLFVDVSCSVLLLAFEVVGSNVHFWISFRSHINTSLLSIQLCCNPSSELDCFLPSTISRFHSPAFSSSILAEMSRRERFPFESPVAVYVFVTEKKMNTVL